MGMAKNELTYEELLQKVKEQELLIKELIDEKNAITNLETFVKESSDLICIGDTNGYYKLVNDGFTKVLGYSREELLSRPFLEFIHPDDLEKTFEEMKKLIDNFPTVFF